MSENIEVPKEVVEKFNEINLLRKKKNQEPLKYVAMDYSNEWYGYCTEPVIECDEWSSIDAHESLCIIENDWRDTLAEMPLEDI